MIYRNKLRMIYTPYGVIETRQFKPKQKVAKISFLSPIDKKATLFRVAFLRFISPSAFPIKPSLSLWVLVGVENGEKDEIQGKPDGGDDGIGQKFGALEGGMDDEH